MNLLCWSYCVQFLLGFLVCVGLFVYVIFLQFKIGFELCLLCIFQWLVFVVLGLLFLIGVLYGLCECVGCVMYGVLVFIVVVVGIGIVGCYVYVQLLFKDMGLSCGLLLVFFSEMMGLLEVFCIVLIGIGDCGNIDWQFLGLIMLMWSLVWFVLFVVWVLFVLFCCFV